MCVRALPFGQGRRHGSKTEEARGGRGAVGAEVERRRRENRGAEGAERVGCGEGAVPPPQKKIFALGPKIRWVFVHSGWYFVPFSRLLSNVKTGGLDLPKYARTSPVVPIIYLGYVNNNNDQF